MKAQFLKIAKCKDEKSFYKKYPTQEAFFKAHPEARSIKKAQIGAYIGGDAVANPKMISYGAEYDAIDKMITGYTDAERRAAAEKAAANQGGGGGGMDLSGIMEMFGKGEGAAPASRYGNRIPKAYVGVELPEWAVDAAETTTDTTTLAPTFDINRFGISAQTTLPRTNTPMQQPQVAPTNNTGFGGVNYSGPHVYSPIPNGNPNGPGGIMGNNASGAPYAPGNVTQSNDYKMGEVNPQAASSSSFDFAKAIPVVGGIIGGIQSLGAQKEAKRAAKQAKKVSDVALAASATRPEETKRRYVTPWDNPVQPEQMFPTYGVGTNVLARYGARLYSGGEIQNTYAPDYLYDDLGYEPLNDSNVKQYYHGGGIPRAQYGLASAGGGGFGENPYGGMVSGVMGNNNAGSQIGGSIGSIFGPIGGAVGSALGGMLDTDQDDIDKYNRQTKANMEGMAMNNMIPGIQSGYRSHLKNGGYMNPEYNPQVITMFGDHTAADFADYANKYRAGGHLKSYTPPSDRAMETYAMGGQLQTHWGGEAETMSYNPYSAGSGEMVKFNGQSHNESDRKGNTGIGITYGESPVEVERGEPMFEMQGGGEVNPQTGEPENTGVVFGNMSIDKKVASQLNDPELMKVVNIYDKVKFKNAGLNLAKQEVKQNKIIDKNSKLIDSFKVETSLDKAKLAGLQANLEGANAKLKNIANTKIILANYQNAINDSKDELSDAIGQNLSAEDLAKGYVKLDKDPVTMNAKWGGSIRKAAEGTTIDPGKITKAQLAAYIAKGYVKDPKNPNRYYLPGTSKEVVTKLAGSEAEIKKGSGPIKDNYKGPKMSNAEWTAFLKTKKGEAYKQKYITGTPDEVIKAAVLPSEKKEMMTTPGDEVIVEDPAIAEGKSKFPWQMYANQALQYLRPTDQEGLDMSQLYPEMYALGSNQLEPVPVQGYRPDLATPYDVSYQDILNANQADYNASQRMVGYNPAAQSVLNAQKYAANEKVLGEQFRANQAMQSGVYDQNRQTLNDAKLKNLGIFDRQYERQAEAKSNTKATTQAALNSIADKYAKNKLENKTLGVYENLYNYRFDKDGRAINMNGLAQFNIDGTDASDKTSAPEGYEYETILKKKKKDVAKNGSILRSFKNL